MFAGNIDIKKKKSILKQKLSENDCDIEGLVSRTSTQK
jgi:hypothetical protein